MTSIRIMWLFLCLVWIAAEIGLAHASAADNSKILASERRSQWLLWLSVLAGLGLALLFKNLGWVPIPIEYLPRQCLAMVFFAAGLYLRYRAVTKLGGFFTTHVSIQHRHRLIVDGPYRWLRHPAYTGLLLALFAAGLAMGDTLALLLLMVATFWAVASRITIEEQMLRDGFGKTYTDYCRTTWKLLPWLY